MRAAPVVSLLVSLVSLLSLVLPLGVAVATLVPSWGRAPVELLDSL